MSEQRFWSKVEFDHESGCWLWVGSVSKKGYGHFWHDGVAARAHRWAYEHFVGPIPEGLQIDHLCRVRHCVRPDHMEPVTNRINTLRGNAPAIAGARERSKTHCKRGHPYDEENTSVEGNGSRKCRACRRDQSRESQARRRAVEDA